MSPSTYKVGEVHPKAGILAGQRPEAGRILLIFG